MYLHLGQDVVIRQQELVGIFDLDNTTVSRLTRDYLQKAEKAGHVTVVSPDLPKSFVICSGKRSTRPKRENAPTAEKQETVYLSQLAPRTLHKRSQDLK